MTDRIPDNLPEAPSKGRHVSQVHFFNPTFPNGGGTVFARPVGEPVAPVDFFRHMPNGGATVYLKPEGGSVDSEG